AELQCSSQSRDDFEAGSRHVIRSLPRIDFGVINSSVMVQGGVDLSILVVDPAVHEKTHLQVEGLPVFRIAGKLISIEESNHGLALLPPFHVSVCGRFSSRTGAVNTSMLFVETVAEGMVDESEAGTANLGILLPTNTPRCLCYQPTGFQIETIFALLGITVVIGDIPIVMKVVAAVADF